MTSTLASLWRRQELIRALIDAELKRDRQTMLGCLWWLLDPLLQTAVFTIFMGWILQRGGHHQPYPLFLMCALVCWKSMTAGVVQAASQLSRSNTLIHTFAFPKAVLPVASVLLHHFFFLIALLPLIGLALLYRHGLAEPRVQTGLSLLCLPPLILAQLILTLGAALLLSCWGVFFQDLHHLLRYAVQFGWYLSPGLYAIADVVPGYQGLASLDFSRPRSWFALNPVGQLFEGYRAVLMRGETPDWLGLGFAFAAGFALLAVGLRVFQSQERRFIKYL